jgi:hypothetical protein
MGGHASWRAALHTPDWFAAVAPVCGGYDYGKQLEVLNNIPLYQVWGERDPHSAKLNEINRKNAAALKQLGYDVVSVGKPGGHELFMDEAPSILEFFKARPRNLYPKKVICETTAPFITESDQGYPIWSHEYTWNKEKPIPYGRAYWVQILEKTVDQEQVNGKPVSKPARITAEIVEPNKISVLTENVKKFRLFFHDRLVDFDKPVIITIAKRPPSPTLPLEGTWPSKDSPGMGGGEVSTIVKKLERSMKTLMAESADDRGRIYFAQDDFEDRPAAEAK